MPLIIFLVINFWWADLLIFFGLQFSLNLRRVDIILLATKSFIENFNCVNW